MDNFQDQILIKINERYFVAVSKDHNKGAVIQVARMNPNHVKNDDTVMYKGHTPVVLYQRLVSFGTSNKNTGDIVFKSNEQMQSEIIEHVLKAKEFANKCSEHENFIDLVFLKIKSELC